MPMHTPGTLNQPSVALKVLLFRLSPSLHVSCTLPHLTSREGDFSLPIQR